MSSRLAAASNSLFVTTHGGSMLSAIRNKSVSRITAPLPGAASPPVIMARGCCPRTPGIFNDHLGGSFSKRSPGAPSQRIGSVKKHRFVPRDRKFESISLQRRVNELSVPLDEGVFEPPDLLQTLGSPSRWRFLP